MKIWAAILVLTVSIAAHAGPLREPRQCAVLWRNIEKVESWSAATKNQIYWQCLSRAMEWKRAAALTVEESIELRAVWLLTPIPELTGSDK